MLVLLWESGVIAIGAGKTRQYYYSTKHPPRGGVKLLPKIVSGAGYKDNLNLEVTKYGSEKQSDVYKYWADIKNTSSSDIVFKLQVFQKVNTTGTSSGSPKPLPGTSKPKPIGGKDRLKGTKGEGGE